MGGQKCVTPNTNYVHLRVDVCDGAALGVHQEEAHQGGDGEESTGQAVENREERQIEIVQ